MVIYNNVTILAQLITAYGTHDSCVCFGSNKMYAYLTVKAHQCNIYVYWYLISNDSWIITMNWYAFLNVNHFPPN